MNSILPYEQRIRRVLDYIYENPGADLSLDALADVAAMSRFHWHRVFLAMTGESCAQAVRRVRMHRASFWLVQTDMPIATIAERLGYTNAQSFTRAFREVMDHSPHAVRKDGKAIAMRFTTIKGDPTMYDVKIENAPPRRLAAQLHRGSYSGIGKSFEQLAAIFTARNLWPQTRGMAAIYHDDPNSVAEAQLRSHAGALVGDDFVMPDALEEVRIGGGDTAILTFKGAYTGLQQAYDWFYGQWLPGSGRVPADEPSYEIYLNSVMDTAPDELLTELCMPLQPSTTG